MALARVQATTATADAQTSVALTFSTAPAVGHGLLVGVTSNWGAAFAADACTDNRGNLYIKALGQGGLLGTESLTIYYCPLVRTTGTPFTITISPAVGAVDFVAGVVEISGVAGGLAVEAAGSDAGFSTAPFSATPGILSTPDLVALAVTVISATQASLAVGTTDTNTPGWIEEGEVLSLGPVIAGEIDSRVLTTAVGALRATWTGTVNGWWAAAVVAWHGTEPPPVDINRHITDLADILKQTYQVKRRRDLVRNVVTYRYRRRYVPSLAGFTQAEGEVLPVQNTKAETDWQVDDQRIADDTSIAKYGERLEDVSFEMLRDGASAVYIAGQILADNTVAPVYVSFEEGPCGIDTDLGDLDSVIHFDGLTDTARVMRCEEHALNLDTWAVWKSYREQ
jgi:hypothetical protein